MDLDADIDRWRNQSRRSSYSSYYRRSSKDAYTADYDVPSKRFFNDELPSSSSAATRRRAPPPPPPPPPPTRRPPPPPPAPSDSNRVVESAKKQRSKRGASRRHSAKHRGRSAASSSSASSSSDTSCTATTKRASSSASSAASSTASDSYGSSTESSSSASAATSSDTDSNSATATTSSSASSSTFSSTSAPATHRASRRRHRRQSMSRSLQTALVRVAQRPGSIAQDEEIAAAAACRAILQKEEALKREELRLLQQKKNFAAEVQRRSSLPHRFTSEDEALRQMQRLVDLEDASPPLEEFLRRTSTKAITGPPPATAPAAKNAETDAGALAYLRSNDAAEARGSMPPINRVGEAPSRVPAGGAETGVEQRTTVLDDTGASKKAADATAKPQNSALPAVKEATSSQAGTASGSQSSLEHSLPVEGHPLVHSAPGTPTEQSDAQSHLDAALAATVEKKREAGGADAGSALAPALTIEADHTEEKQMMPPLTASTPSATKDRKTAVSEATTSAASRSEAPSPSKTSVKPAERVIHIEFPRRRVKVKVRRRRSQSRSHARAMDYALDEETDEDDVETGEQYKDGQRYSPIKHRRSPPLVAPAVQQHEQPRSDAQEAEAEYDGASKPPVSPPPPPPRELLPPPPSPATNRTMNRQQFAVDPLSRFNPSNAAGVQQPWATINWPHGSAGMANAEGQRTKDGPPALWYASNSPVPLSQHEFKSLLCSEYKAPETTYAVAPEKTQREARSAGAVPSPSSDAVTPVRPRTGRETYEPYGDDEATATLNDGGRSPPSAMKKTAIARRKTNVNQDKDSNGRASQRRRSVQVCDPADEAGGGDGAAATEEEANEGDEDERGREQETERGRGKGKGRGKGTMKGRGWGWGLRRTKNTAAANAENREEEVYLSHFSDAADGVDVGAASPQQPPTPPATRPPPPAPVFAEDGESIVEFPPPPHLMATDMPPPGDVGSEGEDSCCGGCCGCCSCWDSFLSCLFPCCCGPKKPKRSKRHHAAEESESTRPLAFQRPASALPSQGNGPTQVYQQEPYNSGAIRYCPDPSASAQEQQHQLAQVQQMQGPPIAQLQPSQSPVASPPVVSTSAQPSLQQQPSQTQPQPPQPQPPPQSAAVEATAAYQTGGAGNTLPANAAHVNGEQM